MAYSSVNGGDGVKFRDETEVSEFTAMPTDSQGHLLDDGVSSADSFGSDES
jgi:hypothetical protein